MFVVKVMVFLGIESWGDGCLHQALVGSYTCRERQASEQRCLLDVEDSLHDPSSLHFTSWRQSIDWGSFHGHQWREHRHQRRHHST